MRDPRKVVATIASAGSSASTAVIMLRNPAASRVVRSGSTPGTSNPSAAAKSSSFPSSTSTSAISRRFTSLEQVLAGTARRVYRLPG